MKKLSAKAVAGRPRRQTTFDHPLVSRYASPEMLAVWSRENRYGTWRRIWVALARAQSQLGLPVSSAQIAALERVVDRIDFAAVARHEKITRHDVMAHIHAYGEAAPAARGVIHLGATSMDIVDNGDLVLMRDGLRLVFARLVAAGRVLAGFALKHADTACLGYTHLQPAQLTTVGKRASLWLADIDHDLGRIDAVLSNLRCRGLRGATGTQASFLALLGSEAKVQRLERLFARQLDFEQCYPVCGQTYSRAIDADVVQVLAGLAATTHRICNDIRLLASFREIQEPFERGQVGSSSMPWKRNPARSERATGLARYLISLASSPLMTHAEQMLERTLDDSANKRLVMPEAFLTADALCTLLHNIFDGLVVHESVIAVRVAAELPFIATESILMQAAKRGGDRQELHERLRMHTRAAAERIASGTRFYEPAGGAREAINGHLVSSHPLVAALSGDSKFAGIRWQRLLDPARHVGLAPRQTRRFVRELRTRWQRAGWLARTATPSAILV